MQSALCLFARTNAFEVNNSTSRIELEVKLIAADESFHLPMLLRFFVCFSSSTKILRYWLGRGPRH
jgi:hypothetical protein